MLLVSSKRLCILFGLCGLIFSACAASGISTNQGGPTSLPSTGDAESVARDFLDKWTMGDYVGMFNLITPRSKSILPQAFTDLYTSVDQTLQVGKAQGKTYIFLPDLTQQQGTTAIIRYNMTFDSKLLGKFSDENRTMRLILTQEGTQQVWRVAWSRMDIFEGMTNGAELNIAAILPARGAILDRTGQPLAEDNVPNYAVRLIPGNYAGGNADNCFSKLAQIFRLRTADLQAKFAQFTAPQRTFGFTIGVLSEADRNAVGPTLDAVCGKMEYSPQTTRFYYSNGIAGQTIGYVGAVQKDQQNDYSAYGSSLIGQIGIEKRYQTQLAGIPGAKLSIKLQSDGSTLRVLQTKAPGSSQDVTLTIDRSLQQAVDDALASAYNYANWAQYSTSAAAVVLNVKTGEVLAMSSYPFYNPDAFRPSTTFDQQTDAAYLKQGALRNHAIEDTHAPGSVFKIVSMAAAVDTKAFKLTDTINDTGTFADPEAPKGVRFDWIYLDKYAAQPNHGVINLIQALTSSCDVYFWTIGSKLNDLNADYFRQYANQMGLGVMTGIDASTEAQGNVPDPASQFNLIHKRWGRGDSLNEVIGQGNVEVTPIQVARMMVGVANGGKLYHPYLVKAIGTPGQPPVAVTPAPPDNMNLDPAVLKGIQEGLCNVTEDPKLGTANFVFSDWYDVNRPSRKIIVCAKTGTAQSNAAEPNGWFAAYAGKAGDPDIAVVVFTERSREGSETSGPIARRIIEAYYNLPYANWPDYWTGPYDPMVDPSMTDGGPARKPTPSKK